MDDDDLSRYEMKAQPDMAIENSLEMQRWLNDPDSKKSFKDINKDIPLSNLNEWEMWLMQNFADFTQQLHCMKLDKAEKYFKFKMFFLANVSLGKNGFAKKLTVTTQMNQEIKRTQPNQKPAFWGKQNMR